MKKGRKQRKVDEETGEVISPDIERAVAIANDQYFDSSSNPAQEPLIARETVKLAPRQERKFLITASVKIKANERGAQVYSLPLTPETFELPGRALVNALSATVRGRVFRHAVEGIVGKQDGRIEED